MNNFCYAFLIAAFVFLGIDGAEFDAAQEECLDLVLSLAAGERTKDEVIAFFRRHVKP